MTDDELNAIERLCNSATPGPWGTIPPGGPNGAFWGICNRMGMIVAMRLTTSEPDAAFIAASRDAIPVLIAEVRRLRAECDGEMLGTNDASWAKAVIIAGVAGMVISLLAGWWDASRGGGR